MSRQELSRLDSFNTFRDFKSDRDDLDDLLDEVADADDDDEDDFSINDDVSKNDDDCKNDDVSIKVENIVKSYEIAIQQQSGGKSSEVSNLLHFFIYSKLLWKFKICHYLYISLIIFFSSTNVFDLISKNKMFHHFLNTTLMVQ